jgi:hypothetical protein
MDAERNVTLKRRTSITGFAKPGLTGLVCSAKARIFNNMLYVRYVHLTKGQAYSQEKPVLSSERMLHKDIKGSVAKRNL